MNGWVFGRRMNSHPAREPEHVDVFGVQGGYFVVLLLVVVACVENTCSLHLWDQACDFRAFVVLCGADTWISVFAILLFILVPDALKILVRYLASAMCCRIIVMYELAGMRYVFESSLRAIAVEIEEEGSS